METLAKTIGSATAAAGASARGHGRPCCGQVRIRCVREGAGLLLRVGAAAAVGSLPLPDRWFGTGSMYSIPFPAKNLLRRRCS